MHFTYTDLQPESVPTPFVSDQLFTTAHVGQQVGESTAITFEPLFPLPNDRAEHRTGLVLEHSNLVQRSRQRDYTKEEKEDFELWITSHPEPKKKDKADYVRAHGLKESQVQSLINNRKRKLNKELAKSSGKEVVGMVRVQGPPTFLQSRMCRQNPAVENITGTVSKPPLDICMC